MVEKGIAHILSSFDCKKKKNINKEVSDEQIPEGRGSRPTLRVMSCSTFRS